MTAERYSIGSDVWPGLSKLVEECGEVIQVVGKLIGSGGEVNHWDGTKLDDRLADELGDLLAAIDFVVDMNFGYDRGRIVRRQDEKWALFHRWQKEQIPLPGESTDVSV